MKKFNKVIDNLLSTFMTAGLIVPYSFAIQNVIE